MLIVNIEMDNNMSGIDNDHLPVYTVKYLGVVEGSMGILSRKMILPNYPFKTHKHIYSPKQYKHRDISNANIKPVKLTKSYIHSPMENISVKMADEIKNRVNTAAMEGTQSFDGNQFQHIQEQ